MSTHTDGDQANPEPSPTPVEGARSQWERDARSALMGLESVLRFPLRHPERGFEDAARLAYGTVCVLLGRDPRPLLPDWPAPTPTPVEATEEGRDAGEGHR